MTVNLEKQEGSDVMTAVMNMRGEIDLALCSTEELRARLAKLNYGNAFMPDNEAIEEALAIRQTLEERGESTDITDEIRR